MPKYIENLRQRLLEEARSQTQSVGYGGVSIRAIAKGCGVGVGTVYNYFPSKDALIAGFMLEDWQLCVDRVEEVSQTATDPIAVVQCIYDCLVDFSHQHSAVIGDKAAAAVFAGAFGQYHSMLRGQLAKPLEKFCADPFSAAFVAEAILTWTMAGAAYEQIEPQIRKLFKE